MWVHISTKVSWRSGPYCAGWCVENKGQISKELNPERQCQDKVRWSHHKGKSTDSHPPAFRGLEVACQESEGLQGGWVGGFDLTQHNTILALANQRPVQEDVTLLSQLRGAGLWGEQLATLQKEHIIKKLQLDLFLNRRGHKYLCKAFITRTGQVLALVSVLLVPS